MKFRKRPLIIEAVQFTGDNVAEIVELGDLDCDFPTNEHCDDLIIETLEGDVMVSPGHWVIRGVQGELYPCRADIFEATYEPVDD